MKHKNSVNKAIIDFFKGLISFVKKISCLQTSHI